MHRTRTHSHNRVENLEGRQLFTATVLGSTVVYPTVQSAVNAAPAGGTVRIAAGQYDELITVAKPLTVLGAQAGVDARSPTRGKSESVVDGYSFAPGSRTSGFYVTANDVTIDGFTVQGQTSGSIYGAGIVLGPSIAGAHVVNDIVRNNVAGLYLSNDSVTDPAVIKHDLFDSNNTPGPNNGRGIYTDGGVSGGLLTNVVIDANTFTNNVGDGTSGNPESAVGLEAQTAGKQFNVAITNNVMANNGKGLLVYNATNVTFSGNLITGSTDTTSAAVRVEGDVTGLTVANNAVLGGTGAAVRVTARFVGPSSNIAVNFNTFAGNAAGIIVDPAATTAPVDGRFNYFGPGQANSGSVTTSPSLAVPPPLSSTFASDNGAAVDVFADVTILSYALSLRNLALLNLLVVPTF